MLEEKQDIPEDEMAISDLYTNIYNHSGIKEIGVGVRVTEEISGGKVPENSPKIAEDPNVLKESSLAGGLPASICGAKLGVCSPPYSG